jgi:hypothetical protein
MIRLTVYRVGETLELLLPKRFTGKDFPSNTVKSIDLAHYVEDKIEEKIYIRPYYRKKINGELNIYAEEEVEV